MTTRIRGIGAAPGIAVGKAAIRRRETPAVGEPRAASPAVELGRLAAAAAAARAQLLELAETVAARAGAGEAAIFRAHLLLLDDPLLINEIKGSIERERMPAERAVSRAAFVIAQKFDALQDSYLRERAADIRDVGQRLLQHLAVSSGIAAETPEAGILVARSLTPSETALVDRSRILAVVAEEGGRTGHAAILARALNLVAVFGAKGVLSEVSDGDWLIVDGSSGEVLVGADEDKFESCRQRMEAEQLERLRLASSRDLPAVTADGFRVTLAANIAGPAEARQALAEGAEGVGVFRTEYLFVNRPAPPTEQEQFEAYRELLLRMAPRGVVVRTVDIGGDKDVACWTLPEEPNPALGMRGIRLSLAREEDFRCQLRALVRAAAVGNLAILLPMISDVTEVRRVREIVEEIRRGLDAEGCPAPASIPLGIMVETPAAAILTADLAEEADFFSIGTNDLVQYVLAADRAGDSAGGVYQPFHPAVLRLICYVARTARQEGKHVAVCGEMAADPLAAPLFIGMEIDELSMSPAAIPAVKDAIRRATKTAADRLLAEALKLRTAAEVIERLERFRT